MARLKQSARQQRFDDNTVSEAFRRRRNYVLDENYYSTIPDVDIGQCLQECLKDKDM